MRLVVDCRLGDDSAVFPREMLDNPEDFVSPWLFDSNDGLQLFNTEEEACAAQRAYRLAHGFDPVTGDAQ